MKTAFLILFSASVVTSGCASTRLVAGSSAPQRGELRVTGRAQRAVVAGPITIHAYSAFTGGEVYTVPFVSGGDSDCLTGQRRVGTEIRLGADQVTSVGVAAGSVACVATQGERTIELLWHARDNSRLASSSTLLARQP